MLRYFRQLIEGSCDFVRNHKVLSVMTPVADAMDNFFFGPDEITEGAPHAVDSMDLKKYMTMVIIGLIPAFAASVYFYGLRVLLVVLVSYTFGGITEVIFSVVRKKPIYEGFLVTGLIFPMVLPPTIPLWMVAVGVVFGVFFGKEVFGGTGKNIFNPALVGRVFLSMAFPAYFASMWQVPFMEGFGGFLKYSSDALTSATPLISFKGSQLLTDNLTLLLGTHAGTIGETFRIGVIIGGVFLLVTKIADWRISITYILSVFVFSFLSNYFNPEIYAPAVFSVLSGGLLFGAFFMITDPVTAPLTHPGKILYGFLAGILTVVIRGLSGFAEGVMFSILLMNAVSPLIDIIIFKFKFKGVKYATKS